MTFTLQTLMPTAVTTTSQIFVMDIDGDTVNELIVFDCDLGQFSVIHQFAYSDTQFTLNNISPTVWPTSEQGTTNPLWPAATSPGWMTSWTAQQGSIPNPGGTAWTIQPGDVIMPADLDGDSIGEFFIYNLNSSTWGVLKWNTTAKELQTIYRIQIKAPTGPPPVLPNLVWLPSQADQYVIVPNLHGIISNVPGAGILAFNTQTLAMGLISYQPSPAMFQQQWQLNGGTALSGWTLHSSDQFYAANNTSPGKPSIVVHSPLNSYIDSLTWNGSALVAGKGQGTSVGGWHFYSGDQLQLADLDGDGLAEILIYNSDTQYLGVLEFDPATQQFYAPAVIHGNIGSGSNIWSISKTNQYFCMNGTNNNPGPILAFGPNSLPLAILNYKKGKFTCQWAGASLAPNKAWPVSSADFFYAADPSTTTTPTWFTLSNQGTSETPKMKLGALTWNGKVFQMGSSATVPLHGWSPSFLAAAPELGFPAFTAGNQAAIYTYVSGLFPLPTDPDSPPQTDIRKLYDQTGDSGKFETFAGKISGVLKVSEIPNSWPPLPSNNNWSDDDWSTVVKTISNECIAVDTVLNISTAIGKLTTDLNALQTTDLTTVTTNINAASTSSPSAVEYYCGQIAVMLLWGIGAAGGLLFPEAGEAALATRFGVFGSMTASAVGSLVGYNPTQQKSFAVDDIKIAIGQTYDQAVGNQSSDLTKVLKDAIKLKIFGGLSDSTWDIKTSLASKVQKPFSAVDRLWMYQQLLPCYLQIRVVTPHAGIMPPPVVYTDPGTGNTYSIGTGGLDYFTSSSLSASLLGQDLFTTLNVSLADFCLGIGPWANIPRWQDGTLVPVIH
ncbi:MAG TPA: hypothetical protein VFS76_14015 [Pyrinomonadaceae bacterium]|nr:hypothetical protein [Pyrinomonadaceae bacterium]